MSETETISQAGPRLAIDDPAVLAEVAAIYRTAIQRRLTALAELGIGEDHPEATDRVREWMVARGLTPGVLAPRPRQAAGAVKRCEA